MRQTAPFHGEIELNGVNFAAPVGAPALTNYGIECKLSIVGGNAAIDRIIRDTISAGWCARLSKHACTL